MGLFCAPAWMMKGAGGASATMLPYSDDDPFSGRTKVNFVVSGLTFTRDWKSSKYSLSFTVVQIGFTSNPVNFWIEVNRDSSGNEVKWLYWDMQQKINLSPGGHYDIDLSRKIKGEAKSSIDYTSSNKIYVVFITNSEIVKDQLHPTVIGDPKPLPT